MTFKAWLIAIGFASLTSGCFIPAGNARVNSSHFVYPNSNVTAGHESDGSVTRLCGLLIFSWNGFPPDATETAYKRAIQKESGDLLINASESRTTIILPLAIVPLIQLCHTEVEGTVAKMEVGKQELH